MISVASQTTAIKTDVDMYQVLNDYLDDGPVLLLSSTGSLRRGTTAKLVSIIEATGRPCTVYAQVNGMLTIALCRKVIQDTHHVPGTQLVALGGGSVIDAAKVLRVLWMEGVSLDVALDKKRSPKPTRADCRVLAIPTTAGTGAEVTPFAALWDFSSPKKYSIERPWMPPDVALLDPSLTLSLPWQQTLETGLDAFAQCFDVIWNVDANDVLVSKATKGITMIMNALPILRSDLSCIRARKEMLEAASLSGICIGITHTSLAHACSYPLTLNYQVPHGLACAYALADILLSMKANDRVQMFLKLAGYDDEDHFVNHWESFMNTIGFPEIWESYGITDTHLNDSVEEMLKSERAARFSEVLSDELLLSCLQNAIHRLARMQVGR